jgi:hypothetical protein
MLTLVLIAGIAAQCANPRTRPEWNQLSAGQKRSFLNAVGRLNERPRGGNNPSTWNYEQFARAHWDYRGPNHDRPPFFVWHREYVYQFEQALRSIDSSVVLPYWDWTLDSQNPGAADVFQPQHFGREGDPGTNCINTGVAANWTGYANNGNCLRRCPDFNAFFSPEGVNGFISRSTTFAQLQGLIEQGPHGAVHLQLGGSCGDFSTMASANDPIFFLHHAMVDKIWWKWQQACPEFVNNYSGNMNAQLAPFGVTAREVMDVRGGRYCYTYTENRGDTPAVRGRCANSSSGTATTTGTASASPTPSHDPYWIQHNIQNLVPNTQQFHVNLTVLPQRNAAAQNLIGKRDIILDSVPEGYYPDLVKGTTTATATATSTDSGAYPTPTDIIYPDYSFNPNYTVHAPPSTDRTEKYLIRYPGALSPEFVKRMDMNPEIVEKIRGVAMQIVDDYNNKKGYVSPAALVNTQKDKCKRRS